MGVHECCSYTVLRFCQLCQPSRAIVCLRKAFLKPRPRCLSLQFFGGDREGADNAHHRPSRVEDEPNDSWKGTAHPGAQRSSHKQHDYAHGQGAPQQGGGVPQPSAEDYNEGALRPSPRAVGKRNWRPDHRDGMEEGGRPRATQGVRDTDEAHEQLRGGRAEPYGGDARAVSANGAPSSNAAARHESGRAGGGLWTEQGMDRGRSEQTLSRSSDSRHRGEGLAGRTAWGAEESHSSSRSAGGGGNDGRNGLASGRLGNQQVGGAGGGPDGNSIGESSGGDGRGGVAGGGGGGYHGWAGRKRSLDSFDGEDGARGAAKKVMLDSVEVSWCI